MENINIKTNEKQRNQNCPVGLQDGLCFVARCGLLEPRGGLKEQVCEVEGDVGGVWDAPLHADDKDGGRVRSGAGSSKEADDRRGANATRICKNGVNR